MRGVLLGSLVALGWGLGVTMAQDAGGGRKVGGPASTMAASTAAAATAPARPPSTQERVERAIARGKGYVLSLGRQGSWDLPAPAREPRPDALGRVSVVDIQNSSQWGGLTALATYALLASGESP